MQDASGPPGDGTGEIHGKFSRRLPTFSVLSPLATVMLLSNFSASAGRGLSSRWWKEAFMKMWENFILSTLLCLSAQLAYAAQPYVFGRADIPTGRTPDAIGRRL